MVVLIVIGMTLGLSAWVSTGPNTDISLGLLGWLDLHRHQFNWSVEGLYPDRLLAEILIAVLLTWFLAAILRFMKAQCAPPNGGPATSVDNMNAPGGPPSVS